MANTFAVEATYGAGPYPYTLRTHVPEGNGKYSQIDIDLAQFPKDATNAPDPAAVKTYIEEQLTSNPALTFQILVDYPSGQAGSTSYPDITGSIEETYDGIDAINEYLGLGIVPPAPPAPVVSGISPTQVAFGSGAAVAISGTGFTGATAVKFGTTDAQSFTVNSDTSISAISPVIVGTVDVTVTTPAGTSAPGVKFTVIT
jgi:hypothetical protein